MIPSLNKYRNISKGFRDFPGLQPSSLYSKTYDEPTYLTFSVFFRMENVDSVYTGFDRFPMPLLNTYIEDSYDIRNQYSSINYLRDTNEFVRAELLDRFINGINHLQSYYQWYFQGIDGLQNLLQVLPETGRRVSDEGRITMTMLEGLDQKMFNLLNTYKQIAWDAKWQRWVLPDMMRYFSMDIYITEFRTFHQSNVQNAAALNNNALATILNMIENTMPTWKLTCERCEFDINSINKTVGSYNVSGEPDQKAIEFDIKVGNVTEEYINPILDTFYNDKLINGLDRSREFAAGKTQSPIVPTAAADGTLITAANQRNTPDYDPTRVSTNPKVHQNESVLAQGQLLATKSHVTGTPFYEQTNKTNAINQSLGTIDNLPPGATFRPDFNPTDPNTWVGNAANLGTAFIENLVESKIDKAKMTKIPGLGISVNEALAVIEAKNFISVLGLVRQAITRSYELSAPPSTLLDTEIIDGTFRQFLLGVSESEATDGDALELAQFADLALSDAGTFSRITDYSLATDLVSPELKEVNIPNPIESPSVLANSIDAQIQGDRSLATDLDGDPELQDTGFVIEGIPSSQATNNPIIKG